MKKKLQVFERFTSSSNRLVAPEPPRMVRQRQQKFSDDTTTAGMLVEPSVVSTEVASATNQQSSADLLVSNDDVIQPKRANQSSVNNADEHIQPSVNTVKMDSHVSLFIAYKTKLWLANTKVKIRFKNSEQFLFYNSLIADDLLSENLNAESLASGDLLADDSAFEHCETEQSVAKEKQTNEIEKSHQQASEKVLSKVIGDEGGPQILTRSNQESLASTISLMTDEDKQKTKVNLATEYNQKYLQQHDYQRDLSFIRIALKSLEQLNVEILKNHHDELLISAVDQACLPQHMQALLSNTIKGLYGLIQAAIDGRVPKKLMPLANDILHTKVRGYLFSQWGNEQIGDIIKQYSDSEIAVAIDEIKQLIPNMRFLVDSYDQINVKIELQQCDYQKEKLSNAHGISINNLSVIDVKSINSCKGFNKAQYRQLKKTIEKLRVIEQFGTEESIIKAQQLLTNTKIALCNLNELQQLDQQQLNTKIKAFLNTPWYSIGAKDGVKGLEIVSTIKQLVNDTHVLLRESEELLTIKRGLLLQQLTEFPDDSNVNN